MFVDPAQVRARRAAQPIESLSGQHRFRTTSIAGARPALDEAVEHEAIDEARDTALAEDHAVGELTHPDPSVGGVGDRKERIVFGERQVVLGAQLLVEAPRDPRVRGQERTPGIEARVLCGDVACLGTFGDGHRCGWYMGLGGCSYNYSARRRARRAGLAALA